MPITRLEVDIEAVFPNKWNPNVQHPIMFEKTKNSIKEFGFVDPILVREIEPGVYEIIGGEHRWKAAKELGIKKIPIDNMGKLEDPKAKTLCLLANIRGKDEAIKLAKLVKELPKAAQLLIPYNEQEIDVLQKMLDFDFSQFEGAKPLDEDKDQAGKILELALKLEREGRKLHDKSEDQRIRLFMEQMFDWVKTLKTILGEI